ncbi:MAG TPA: DMT family transporter [Gemmatimonadaceae bacterium]|nr:DMT family transporter [Gemmatimonadaceae bacterium]
MSATHPVPFSASSARATLLVLLSAISFGGISVITVFASREGMAVLNLVFWRFLFAAIVLFAIASADVRAHWRAGIGLFVAGGLLQAVCTYMSLSSLRFIPASVVAFLFFTYPAWLALTSAARGTDPLTPKRGIILLIAMAGVALMIGIPGVGSGARLNVVGIALALGSALLYSTYLPIVNHLQRGIPQIPAAFFIIFGSLLSFFLAGVLLSQPWTNGLALSALALPGTPRAWIYVLLLALVSTVMAFLALMAGLRTLGSTRTSIIATAEPFFTTILAVVFLAEGLRWTTLVGGACIAGAVVAIVLEREVRTAND